MGWRSAATTASAAFLPLVANGAAVTCIAIPSSGSTPARAFTRGEGGSALFFARFGGSKPLRARTVIPGLFTFTSRRRNLSSSGGVVAR